MKNFEKFIDKVMPLIGDCGLYKLRAADEVAKHKGCGHDCRACQKESKAWLLKEVE